MHCVKSVQMRSFSGLLFFITLNCNWQYLTKESNLRDYSVILPYDLRISTNRSSQRRFSVRKGLIRNFTKFKKVFSCEFCEIYQNNFFTEHLWESASVQISDLRALFLTNMLASLISSSHNILVHSTVYLKTYFIHCEYSFYSLER